MLKSFRNGILILATGLLVLSPLVATLTTASASAAQENPADQLDKWLYYRGMRACLDRPVLNNSTISASKVNAGKLGIEAKKGFGYLAPDMDDGADNDGTVDCSDGSIFVRGAKIFGFNNTVDLVCAMNRALNSSDNKKIEPSNAGDCEKSKEFKLEGGGGSVFQRALTKALEKEGSKDRPSFQINDNNGPSYASGALLYLIGKNSLEIFCGDNVSITSAGSGDIDNDDVVSVDAVIDGVVKPSLAYALGDTDRNEDSKVDDIYYNQGGDDNNAKDLRCHEMAKMTRDNSAAYAAWAIKNLDAAKENENPTSGTANPTSGEESTTCAIDGLGWIICPLMTFMADIVDSAYNYISSLLVFQPITGSGSSKPIYDAWSNVRNIANVAFVVVFLLVIYSQITGMGITNYGIKKLLPRLLVAAILVNASFWICSIAVDLSNILGQSARDLFSVEATTDNLFKSVEGDTGSTGKGWSGIVGIVLAAGIGGAAALYIGLSALLPALIAALLAIVTVFLVLTLRQALLVLLIVISPLAFVAFLLPNTEDWFKKWKGLFQTLLLMFPIIGFIFGASAMASQIVMSTADGDYKVAIQIMGALISILPLAITPLVMKTAGGVLNRFGGIVNNPNKGPFDRLRKGAENVRERQENRRGIRALNGGRVFGRSKFERKAKKDAIDSSLKRERQSQEQQFVAGEVANNDGGPTRFGRQLAGGGPLGGGADAAAIQRAIGSAQFTIDKAEIEEAQAARVSFERSGMGSDQAFAKLNDPSANTTAGQRTALRQMVVEAGDAGQISEIWDDSPKMAQTERNAFADALKKNKPSGVGMGSIAGMQGGSGDSFESTIASGLVAGRYDANGTASADSSELKITHEVLSNPVAMQQAVDKYNSDNPTQPPKSIASVTAQVKADAKVVIDDHRFSPGKSTTAVERLRDI